jgi:hypothetical protein
MNTKSNLPLTRRLSRQATVLLAVLALAFTLTAARAATVTLTNSDGFGYSSFITNPAGQNTNWDNGLPPSSGLPLATNTYYMTNKNLRTPATTLAYTFAGDVLYVGGGSAQAIFQMKGTNMITVPNLQLGNLGIIQNSGTTVAGFPQDTARLAGSINVVTNGTLACSGATSTLAVTATISGTNTLGNGLFLSSSSGGYIQLNGSHPYTGALTESGMRVDMDGTFSMTPSSLSVGVNSALVVVAGVSTNVYNSTNVVAPGGNLNVIGGSGSVFRVGIRTSSKTNDLVAALLDVSKQSSFTANVGLVTVGQNQDAGTGPAACSGVLLLATNNTIMATSILIGDSPTAGSAGNNGAVTLGAGSNLIDTATLTVGGRKVPAQMTLPSGGLLVLTNSGSGRANLNVANNATGTSALPTANLDLSGGTLIASVDRLYVGQKSSGATGGATGTLTVSTNAANRMDANAIFLGYMTNDSAGASGVATGTLTIGGGKVLVNNVTLGYLDVAGNGKSVGILNLNGGTFTVAGAITNGLGNGTINLTNATLIASNTVGDLTSPITKFALTNSILQFGTSTVITNFAVSNLVVGGTANTIRISSAPTNNYSATLPLISYVNFSGTNNFQPDFTILSNTYPSLTFGGSIITNNNVLFLNLVIANANHPPMAQSFDLGLQTGTSATVDIFSKYPPFDADGDPMTVSEVGTPGISGNTFSTDGTNVTYTAINTGMDVVSYSVSDGHGGTGIGYITNVVTASTDPTYNLISGPVNNGNGTLTINYAGIPAYKYALETTTNLPAVIWTPVVTNPAAGNGMISFTFSIGLGQGYYRTRYVP